MVCRGAAGLLIHSVGAGGSWRSRVARKRRGLPGRRGREPAAGAALPKGGSQAPPPPTRGLDVAQRGDARKDQVGQRLAQRQAGHGLGVDQALQQRWVGRSKGWMGGWVRVGMGEGAQGAHVRPPGAGRQARAGCPGACVAAPMSPLPKARPCRCHPPPRRTLMGCSPMAVAEPVSPKCVCAITATSLTGSCSGPQHCCCAIRPVTERSTWQGAGCGGWWGFGLGPGAQMGVLAKARPHAHGSPGQAVLLAPPNTCGPASAAPRKHPPLSGQRTLVVRKRLEQTAGRRSTRSSAAAALVPAGSARSWVGSALRSNLRRRQRRCRRGR